MDYRHKSLPSRSCYIFRKKDKAGIDLQRYTCPLAEASVQFAVLAMLVSAVRWLVEFFSLETIISHFPAQIKPDVSRVLSPKLSLFARSLIDSIHVCM